MSQYSKTSQELEICLNKLILMSDAISSITNGSCTDSENEEMEGAERTEISIAQEAMSSFTENDTTPSIISTAALSTLQDDTTNATNASPIKSDLTVVEGQTVVSEHVTQSTVGKYRINVGATDQIPFNITDLESSLENFTNELAVTDISRIENIKTSSRIENTPHIDHTEAKSQIENTGAVSSIENGRERIEENLIENIKATTITENNGVPSYMEKIEAIPFMENNETLSCVETIDNYPLRKHNSQESVFSSVSSAQRPSPVLYAESKRNELLSKEIQVESCKWESDVAYPVMVTSVVSPWEYHLQLINPDNTIMEQLCMEFMKEAVNGYKGGLKCVPPVGYFCCAKSPTDETWYRAKIVEVIDEQTAKVLFIDEGFESIISNEALRPLQGKFASTPMQSFKCILGGLQPKDAFHDQRTLSFNDCNQLWSSTSFEWMVNLLEKNQNILIAYLYYPPSQSCQPPHSLSRDLLVCDLYLNHMSVDIEWGELSYTRPPIHNHLAFLLVANKFAGSCSYFNSELNRKKSQKALMQYMEEKDTTNSLDKQQDEASDKQIAATSQKQTSSSKEISYQNKSPTQDKNFQKKSPATKDGIENLNPKANEYQNNNDTYVRSDKISKNVLQKNVKSPIHSDVTKQQNHFKSSRNIRSPTSSETSRRSSTSTSREERKKKSTPSASNKTYFKEIEDSRNNKKNENQTIDRSNNKINNIVPIENSKQLFLSKPINQNFVSQPLNQNSLSKHTNQLSVSQLNNQSSVFQASNKSSVSQPARDGNYSDDQEDLDDIPIIPIPVLKKKLEFGKAYKETLFVAESEGFAKIVVSEVVSPGLFYVHLVTPEIGLLDELMGELNLFYLQYSDAIRDASKEIELKQGYPVVARFSSDLKWYRALIIEINSKEDQYDVLYVDFGSSERLTKLEILPLCEEFCELPQNTIPCCLADIAPFSSMVSKPTTTRFKEIPGGNELPINHDDIMFDSPSVTLTWSHRVIMRFKELVSSGLMLLAALKVDEQNLDGLYEVYLYDTSEDKDMFINQQLVNEGLVTSQLFCKQVEQITITEEELEVDIKALKLLDPMSTWDPMTEQYRSKRNTYDVNIDDVGVATLGYVHKGREVCHNFQRRGHCYRGNDCKFLHANANSLLANSVEAYCFNQPIELPDDGDWVAVTVTALYDPTHIWVNFPYGIDLFKLSKEQENGVVTKNEDRTMARLQQLMDEYYLRGDRSAKTDLSVYAEGELVAAKYEEDQSWYRARVIKVADEFVQVCYVDFGNTDVVTEDNIRQLIPDFLHLPFQAVECFLEGVSMEQDGNADVYEELRFDFRDMTSDRALVAQVKKRSIGRTLTIDLYDTSVTPHQFINDEIKKWKGVRTVDMQVKPATLKKNNRVQIIPG